MVQRLPIVSSDDGAWGTILNNFLGKEHFDNGADTPLAGGHKTITVVAGTVAGGTAPLKFNSGPLLTVPEAGAIEFNTNKIFYTTTTPVRMTVAAFPSSTTVANGDLYYGDGSGVQATLPVGGTGQVLTVNAGVPSWTASPGLTQPQVMAITSMRI
jgi:hypothetical protein